MLYFDISKNQKLEAKRNPMFEKNRFAKALIYLSILFWAAYLIFLGVLLPFALEESSPEMESFHLLDKYLPVFLFIDFLIRFIFPTPVQEIKPYLLLPVPKGKVMFCFLVRKIFHPFNLFWLFFFFPFAIVSIMRFYGFTGVIGYILGIWLLMVANCYWSMVIRVLKRQRFAYILLVIPAYGILALCEFLPETGWVSAAFMYLGEGFFLWKAWAFGIVFAGIILWILVNYKVQKQLIFAELSRKEEGTRRISSYAFFDRYGSIGEYIRLELKMLFRNKTPRSQFWSFTILIILCSFALSTNLYGENTYMNHFICLYCYVALGLFTLNQAMSIEGNYIDGLMVRKESIYHMLLAKYYLQCVFLIIPFLCCLVPVFLGTISILMSVSYLIFTMGVVFAAVMQTTVYNSKTLPLDSGMMAKRQGNNTYQAVTAIASFSLPLFLNRFLASFFSETTTCIVFIVLGLIGFCTHRIWIRNIYRRLMKRRYQNMEGFRNTR